MLEPDEEVNKPSLQYTSPGDLDILPGPVDTLFTDDILKTLPPKPVVDNILSVFFNSSQHTRESTVSVREYVR